MRIILDVIEDVTMKIILSYKATLDRGGQGLNFRHVFESFPNDFEKVVFSETPHLGIQVPKDNIANLLWKIPLVRKRRDLIVMREQFYFDQWVSKKIPAADYLVAGVGHALETFRMAKSRNIRCILDVTTNHVDQFGESQDQEIKKFGGQITLHPRLRKKVRDEYQIADRIRVMSEVSKNSLVERGVEAGKIFVATPPISNPSAPTMNLSGDIFRVVFVGLLEPAKGFHYLVEAFKALRGNCQLDLYGGPGLRGVARYLKKATESDLRIKVIPKTVQGCFEEVYCKASVLVLPSLSDGFGYVVGEAMACGVPVIVTSSCGAADLVKDGVAGFVVPPSDSQALLSVLEYCQKNPQARNRLGKAGISLSAMHTTETFWRAWEIGIL